MNDFKLEVTDQYERLVKFFVENQLEFDGDEEVDTDIVKCWKAEAEDDKLAGGCVLAMRQGRNCGGQRFQKIRPWKADDG